jgi:hypothetical protein
MFLSLINWRHIVGALVTGIVLQVAGIINFWVFLGLVAMAITIALAQYLPVGRRTVTMILVVGVIATIGIPTASRFISGHWPLTAKALKAQNRASDLKGAETFNQPGLLGLAGMRKLAEQKEQKLTALALSWFEHAAELYADGKFADAEAAELNGRKVLDNAISAREADAQYIKDKLASVKVPAGWWQDIKDFLKDLDVAAAKDWVKEQGFPFRLFLLGAILLLIGTLLLRRLSKGFGGAVVLAGSVAIVWALWILFTPELAPNPTSLRVPVSAAHIAAPTRGEVHRKIVLSPGEWSAPVVDPPGVYKSFFRGPNGTRVKFADGIVKPVGKGTAYNHPTPMRFYNANGGEVEIMFRPL